MMLIQIATIAALLLVVAAIIQWSISLWFRLKFTRRENARVTTEHQQHAAVLMSVRGCDPSLGDSLKGILNQEYDSYEVHLVIDHRTDPAWDFVNAIQLEHDQKGRLTVHELDNPGETCSLKCHAIVQSLSKIGDDTKIVAFLDADVTPHPTWLAEIATPLANSSIGGATGNQWFAPPIPSGIGSLLRSAWNAGALVPTIFFANPWAGSFAMRAEDLHRSGLIEIWSRSAVDDGPIREALDRIGLRMEFVPSLIMVNRESCTFAYVNRWVTRMLTWSRLYEKTFFLTVIHALFSNSVMIANFAILAIAILMGAWEAGLVAATGLIFSGWLSVAAYFETRKCVAYSCSLRGESLPPNSVGRLGSVFAMVAVAQLVYGVSCFRAMVVKRISWRGINYEFEGGSKIRRLNYEPYLPSPDSSRSKVSI